VRTAPNRSIKVARIAGIPIAVSPWWLFAVVLMTWLLGEGYYPSEIAGISPAAAYTLGLASVLLLFASVLAHEFGHAIVARKRGISINEIDLWLLGGMARMSGRPQRPQDELAFAAAGPAVTAAIAVMFGSVAVLLPSAAPAPLRALIDYQAEVNGLILALNLVPGFPLDGGRILRAVLWDRRNDIATATDTAADVGRTVGWIFVAIAAFLFLGGDVLGLWLGLIGAFLIGASGAERIQEESHLALEGLPACELMSHPAVSIPSDLPASDAAAQYFSRYRYAAFPVLDRNGRAIGLLSIDQIESMSPAQRGRTIVGECANKDEALIISRDDDVAQLLDQPAFARVGRAVVVDDGRRPTGVISVTDIERVVRARRLAPPRADR